MQDLEILYARVGLEVIHVLNLFMAFVVTFNLAKTHNICVLQLDPQFKRL
jgi:hypothetical protein